jgi:hypothetical protein
MRQLTLDRHQLKKNPAKRATASRVMELNHEFLTPAGFFLQSKSI